MVVRSPSYGDTAQSSDIRYFVCCYRHCSTPICASRGRDFGRSLLEFQVDARDLPGTDADIVAWLAETGNCVVRDSSAIPEEDMVSHPRPSKATLLERTGLSLFRLE